MPAPHALHMPPAGQETVVKGLSYQSRIELSFPMQALFVGVKGHDLVFSRNDGSRLVLEGYLTPLSSPDWPAAPDAGRIGAALLAAAPPAIIVNGKEMSPVHFFSSLGEEGMPQVDTSTSRDAAYQNYEHSELQGGIGTLGGLFHEEPELGGGRAKTDDGDAAQRTLGGDARGGGSGLGGFGQGSGGAGGPGTGSGSGTGSGTGNDTGSGNGNGDGDGDGSGSGTGSGNGSGTDLDNPATVKIDPALVAARASLTEDDTDVSGQIPTPQDAGTGQNLAFIPQTGILGNYGSFSMDASGAYSYQLNNTLPGVQGLGLGQSLTETFTYSVDDGQGGTLTNTVTITIDGLNDAPTVASAATSMAEDQDNTTGILPSPQDVDATDSPQYIEQTNTAGLYGSLNLSADGSFIYTLNNSLPVVQQLGVTDFLTETLNYTVDDGHGGTASGSLVITIYGTNDEPVVTAATAMIDEDGPALMGVLPTPYDVDASDTPQFIPQAASVGAYGVLSVDAQGNYTYILDNARPEIQALGQGETLTELFVFTVTDGHSQVSKTLTITINGTNDMPTVAASSASLQEHEGLVEGTLPTPQDVDANDSLNFVEQHSAPGLYGSLSVDAAGNYTYILNYAAPAVQSLAAGQQLTESFTYTVTDQHGATATNTLTITINGTNDAPLVGAAVASINEDDASINGTLPAPTDIDVGDTLSFLPQTGAPGLYGSFTLQTDGSYTYALNNALPAVQELGVGAQLTESFTYTVTDQHGATATNTITITINGTNNAPLVGAAVASINEDQASISGTLPAPTDVDVGDTLSFLPQTGAPGLYGSFTLQADGSYTYALNNALPAVQELGVGAQLTESFTYTVTDQHGATATNTLTITINGTNDNPVIAPIVTTALKEDGTLTSSGTLMVSDVDLGDAPVFQAQNITGLYGSFVLNSNGAYVYTLNNALPAVQGLGQGEQLVESFTVAANDGHGGIGARTISFTINGTNDAPSVGPATAAIINTADKYTGKLPTPTDPDNTLDNITSDTLSFVPKTNESGNYGWLTVNADGSYIYTPNTGLLSVLFMTLGVTLKDTFTYTVTDEHGATASNTLTMSISGGLLGSISLTTIVGGTTGLLGNLLVPGYANATFTLESSAEGKYGTLTLSSNGTYSYDLTSYGIGESQKLGEGETVTDVFMVKVTSNGKSVTTPLGITLTGTNDAPTVQQAYLSVSEDDVAAMYGQLVIADPDASDTPRAVPQTTVGLYGTFYLNTNGSYTYVLNKDAAAVTALNDGDSLEDIFNVTVVDGHSGTAQTTVTVTINGTGEAPLMQGMGAMRLLFVPDDLDAPDNTAQDTADSNDTDDPAHTVASADTTALADTADPADTTALADTADPADTTDQAAAATAEHGDATGQNITNANHTDGQLLDADQQEADTTGTRHDDSYSHEIGHDLLDEELADSLMNDQAGPLLMDLEDVLLAQERSPDDTDALHLASPQDDSLFPAELGGLMDSGHLAPAGEPAQAGAENLQTQAREEQASPDVPPPGVGLTESETDQMALLQTLTQNGH